MSWFNTLWKSLQTSMENDEQIPGFENNFNSFTPRAQQVLGLARKEADRFQHNFLGTEHVLLGLLKLGQGTAVNVLESMDLNLETIRLEVEKQLLNGPDPKVLGNIPYTPRVKKVLSLAAKEAKNLNHTYVGTEHILLGLLREGDGVAGRVLRNLSVNLERTRTLIQKELDPNYAPVEESGEPSGALQPESPQPVEAVTSNTIDTSRRYDIYCGGPNQTLVVYRNVLIKGRSKLLPQQPFDVASDFLELEQANGQTFFVSRRQLHLLCEHGNEIAIERIQPGK